LKEPKSKKQNIKTSNFDRMTDVVRKATSKNLQSVVVPLELFEYAGETQKAVFLARLIYLSDKGSKPNGFIWKSYPEWKREIGLSQSQVERIVKDFQERGILIAKKMMAASGNGNASNTWHYKLLMNKFLSDFKKFLAVRNQKNLQFEPEETSASITESTNIKTTNASLYEEDNSNSYEENQEEDQEEENEDATEENDSDDSLASDCDPDFDDPQSLPPASEQRLISLPADFKPTLENKVWAMTTFPRKSLKLVTDKFYKYFRNYENVVREPEEWQMEWRKWVTTENQPGVNREGVEEEHLEITNELLNLVWKFFNEPEHHINSKKFTFFVVPPKAIDVYFCMDRDFDKKSIDESVDDLFRQGSLAKYFDCYYNKELYEKDLEWAKEVDKRMFNFTQNIEECKKIFAFVREKLAVMLEDVFKAFPDIPEDSINNLFRVCIAERKFRLVGDYYYEHFDSWEGNTEDEEYSIAVNKKLADLGLDKLWEEVDSEEEDAVEIEGTSYELVSSGSSMEENKLQTTNSESSSESSTEPVINKIVSDEIRKRYISNPHASAIVKVSYQIKPYLMHRDSLYAAYEDYLSKNDQSYSQQHFDEGLKHLCVRKIFQSYFKDYYINLFEYNLCPDWRKLTREEISETDIESHGQIINFITERVLVLDDVVEEQFSNIHVKELQLFINAKINLDVLALNDHYIYNAEQYNSNPGYKEEVDKKMQELGLLDNQ
jgi:hypothetical protein